ncbi:MAG: N-acetylmuramoyl-L-alanine amidase-like domain-containing protein [Minisyncoccales bacterium]
MKKKIILIIIIISFVLLFATIILYQENKSFSSVDISSDALIVNENETDWQWVEKQKKLYELTPIEIDLLLKELRERFPDKDERLKAIAVLRLGTPYQLGCLGEESGPDKDPIFRIDVADCTVFVLTNTALVHSQNLEQAREMMKFLNYRPEKEITYENRLHFTLERNMVSPYFRDLTEEIAGKEKIITKKVILNRIKTDDKRWIDIDWEKEIIIKYVPNKYIDKDFLNINLPKSIGVAFIKEKYFETGLDVVHEGLLFDGELLIEASSMQKKVVAKDFYDYYFGKDGFIPKFDGIILFDLTLLL